MEPVGAIPVSDEDEPMTHITDQDVLMMQAFECLPDNPFSKQLRLSENGVPYFYGGRMHHVMLRPTYAWSQHNYYFKNEKFLMGFDCIGYIRYIYSALAIEIPRISEILKKRVEYGEYIDVKTIPLEELYTVLEVGDLIAESLGNDFHILMYIGTLRAFGYTEYIVPKELLDRPLVVHCTSVLGNEYYRKYKQYIRVNKLWECIPPAGGVIVSILGEIEEAPAQATLEAWQNRKFGFMDLEGYELTFYSWEKCDKRIIWRPLI
jgi:hypothetical protein